MFKGYVFELDGNNDSGRPVGSTITVVSNVAVNGVATGFQVVDQGRHPARHLPVRLLARLRRTRATASALQTATTQRIFIFTSSQSDSQNANMTLPTTRTRARTARRRS